VSGVAQLCVCKQRKHSRHSRKRRRAYLYSIEHTARDTARNCWQTSGKHLHEESALQDPLSWQYPPAYLQYPGYAPSAAGSPPAHVTVVKQSAGTVNINGTIYGNAHLPPQTLYSKHLSTLNPLQTPMHTYTRTQTHRHIDSETHTPYMRMHTHHMHTRMFSRTRRHCAVISVLFQCCLAHDVCMYRDRSGADLAISLSPP
jgi:hypothetical protein